MSMDFDPSLGDAVSRLRVRLGDTDIDNPDFDDEMYQAFLDENGGNEEAAILPLVRSLVAKYAREPSSWKSGQESEDYGNRLAFLQQLKVDIERQTLGRPIASFTDPDSCIEGSQPRLFTIGQQF